MVPGRTAISFAPTYSMYPEYARDAMTTWVAGRRHEDFSFDFDEARRLIEEHRPSVILLPSPNNPTGTALPHDVIGQLCAMSGDGDRGDRRGVRRVPPRRHARRAGAARRSTATCWSPAR